ncbi:N12 class adenine-specific DNA methylase [Sphingomonas sp. BE270]|jgi:N12 class adenine-specific DNA methylase|uniref:helicase-related protein n=1 Tax=Sphingomonas sp. BE270 TaxID=2817726 RepID=UPI0028571B92|nr:helicase-related protein [Sphingomonas sp. BE270]MDR7256250.1 N12 class adenine-specific DNA methylase [Sphingomonas sp. BE270]
MRNSASALALQLSLDFDQIVASISGAIASDSRETTLPSTEVIGRTVAAPPVKLFDFSLAAGRNLAPSWKGRAQDNIDAIKLLNLLDGEHRQASPAEQDIIAKFVGFGASELANNIFAHGSKEFRQGWEDLGKSLIAETTDLELQSLKRATQYAHYTPEYIIRAMWDATRILGFTGGQILEPGCGSGLFMGLRPDDLSSDTVFVGIENDPVTARVASALYPNQLIRCVDFDKASLPRDFDLAIGNPPFSNLSIHNKTQLGRLGLSLHDFFIANALEHLRPGGIAMFVTSRYSLDKSDPKARCHIDGIAHFLGAVRLPSKAMRDEAGTDVVVDILLFQKRASDSARTVHDWIELGPVPDSDEGFGPLQINNYFLQNPGHVLGSHEWRKGQFGMEYSCAADPRVDLREALVAALSAITARHEGAYSAAERATSLRDQFDITVDVAVGTAADEADFKEGSYLVSNGILHQIVDGIPTIVGVKTGRGGSGMFAKHANIIRGLIPIRDTVRAILRAQLNDRSYADCQERLLTHYRQFIKKHGPINRTITSIRIDPETGAEKEFQRRPNLQPFLDDPDVWLVASIENYDEVNDAGTPGPIFTERVVKPPVSHEIHSAQDALAVSLHERGRVDIPLIAGLLGTSESEALADLAGDVYLDALRSTPQFDHWVAADEALSGPVRTKLALAREKAVTDPRFNATASALESVQPVDLKPSEITARLGAPWVPVDVIEAFVAEAMEVQTRIHHTVALASWTVDKAPFLGHVSSTSTWGTARRGAADLLEDALNSHIPKIYDTWRDENGSERRELNVTDTEAAKEKLASIKSTFETWVWQESDRADRLVRIYNDAFNNLVPRAFNGKHLQLPGASTAIRMRDHQKRVIWRILAAGSTYVAHSVGAGKTFSLCAAVMEQRRLGLTNKPMIAVPNHCLAQIAREFLMLYPTARILVADDTNFVREKRQRFLARAATGNWDAIIITHDAFKFVPTPAAFEKQLIEDQLASYEVLITGIDNEDRVSRKRVERLKEGLKQRLENLQTRKDDLVHIGEIGIDQILVDEAQQFRKLTFATNLGDLKGVDPAGSQRAWDLYVKSRYLAGINPGRELILSSGTPITNTLGEMYTLQRFMQPDELSAKGLHEFDAWAANFGDTRTELELQPSGSYKPVTRFCEFVNVADLMAMYRSVADVVLKDDLRQYVRLPTIKGGKRKIIVAKSGAPFKAYQRVLAERIKAIEHRSGRPQKGDDILLSVITDGRHSAIDLRFVDPAMDNEEGNKLNLLVENAYRIWNETRDDRYTDPETGKPYQLPGAVQMIFSDLGTEAALETRGFSAYVWIRDRLVEMGVPADQIAFMQHYKKNSAKQRLFNDLNQGRRRFVLGSTATMGTGVNAQQRLKALHHLDVPWLPSDIEQREGRIERQGNQNDEIELYGYATSGSMDATNWQMLERKARFIAMAMSGDRSIRRIEDVGSNVNQFALAKALASGDDRLMRKAGLDAEVARLLRLRDAHIDDQYNIRRTIKRTTADIENCRRQIVWLESDIARRIPTDDDEIIFSSDGTAIADRKAVGEKILRQAHEMRARGIPNRQMLGTFNGIDLEISGYEAIDDEGEQCICTAIAIQHHGEHRGFEVTDKTRSSTVVGRIESSIRNLDADLANLKANLEADERRLPAFEARLGQEFSDTALLEDKIRELADLEAELANTKGEFEPGNDNAPLTESEGTQGELLPHPAASVA